VNHEEDIVKNIGNQTYWTLLTLHVRTNKQKNISQNIFFFFLFQRKCTFIFGWTVPLQIKPCGLRQYAVITEVVYV